MTTFILIFSIIFLILFLVYKFDLIPDFSKIGTKVSKTTKSVINIENDNSVKVSTADKARNLKIVLDQKNDELTSDDIELRNTLFEKHIKHYKVYEGPNGEMKANIPFQAVIFLTRKYNPLVNEYGEIVVSVKAEKDKLLLKSVEDYENNFIQNNVFNYSEENENPDIPKILKQETLKESEDILKKEETSSFLGDFSEDDFSEDDLLKALSEEINEDLELPFSIEEDNENYNPFSVDEKEEDISVVKIVEDIEDDNTQNNMFFISKDFISDDSIINNKVDFMDVYDMIDNNIEKIQNVLINNIFVENQVAFFDDKSVFIPLKTFAKSAALGLSSITRHQIIIEKELKNHKNLSIVEDLYSFLLSNKEFVIFKQENKPFQQMSIQNEKGEICKTQGVRLYHSFIKKYLPDEYSKLMLNPMKTIKISDKPAEKFCQ